MHCYNITACENHVTLCLGVFSSYSSFVFKSKYLVMLCTFTNVDEGSCVMKENTRYKYT